MKDNYVYPGYQRGPGMEVRDLFAAHAMQGILAHTGIDTPFMEGALAAWVAADFMLDLREKSFEERMAIVAEQAGDEDEYSDKELREKSFEERMAIVAEQAGDEDEYSDKEFLSELAGLIKALKEAGKEGNENAA
jgi:hypothetical protein